MGTPFSSALTRGDYFAHFIYQVEKLRQYIKSEGTGLEEVKSGISQCEANDHCEDRLGQIENHATDCNGTDGGTGEKEMEKEKEVSVGLTPMVNGHAAESSEADQREVVVPPKLNGMFGERTELQNGEDVEELPREKQNEEDIHQKGEVEETTTTNVVFLQQLLREREAHIQRILQELEKRDELHQVLAGQLDASSQEVDLLKDQIVQQRETEDALKKEASRRRDKVRKKASHIAGYRMELHSLEKSAQEKISSVENRNVEMYSQMEKLLEAIEEKENSMTKEKEELITKLNSKAKTVERYKQIVLLKEQVFEELQKKFEVMLPKLFASEDKVKALEEKTSELHAEQKRLEDYATVLEARNADLSVSLEDAEESREKAIAKKNKRICSLEEEQVALKKRLHKVQQKKEEIFQRYEEIDSRAEKLVRSLLATKAFLDGNTSIDNGYDSLDDDDDEETESHRENEGDLSNISMEETDVVDGVSHSVVVPSISVEIAQTNGEDASHKQIGTVGVSVGVGVLSPRRVEEITKVLETLELDEEDVVGDIIDALERGVEALQEQLKDYQIEMKRTRSLVGVQREQEASLRKCLREKEEELALMGERIQALERGTPEALESALLKEVTFWKKEAEADERKLTDARETILGKDEKIAQMDRHLAGLTEKLEVLGVDNRRLSMSEGGANEKGELARRLGETEKRLANKRRKLAAVRELLQQRETHYLESVNANQRRIRELEATTSQSETTLRRIEAGVKEQVHTLRAEVDRMQKALRDKRLLRSSGGFPAALEMKEVTNHDHLRAKNLKKKVRELRTKVTTPTTTIPILLA